MDDVRPALTADLPRLVSDLEGEDPICRAAASRALGEARAFGSVDMFLHELDAPDAGVCRWAATSLGLAGDPRALGPLVCLLESPDAIRRESGAFALGLLGHQGAVEPLVASLADPVRCVSRAAALSLTRLGDDRGEVAVWGHLLEQIEFEDAEDRAFAARTLGALSDPRACPALIRALNDPVPEVRADAACALGNCGDTGAVEFLLTAGFTDPEEQVRDAAMFSLARLSSSRESAIRLA